MKALGARVLVRRSGPRPTKADPHYYDGRFLRFTATERNIVYYDEVTKRNKTGRHCTIDEFHYDSIHRPSGACQVLDAIDPTLCHRHPSVPADDHILIDPADDLPQIPLDSVDPNLAELSHLRGPYTAQAAPLFHHLSPAEQLLTGIEYMSADTNMYRPPRTVRIALNRLPTLGFHLVADHQHGNVYLQGCQEGTQASRIPRWKADLRHAILLSIDGTRIHNLLDVTTALAKSRAAHHASAECTFAKIEPRAHADHDVPQLHYDQLKHIHQLLVSDIPTPITLPSDCQAALNLTRAKLKLQDDFDQWIKGEWNQLDKYELRDMFGTSIPWPDGATVLGYRSSGRTFSSSALSLDNLSIRHAPPVTAAPDMAKPSLWRRPTLPVWNNLRAVCTGV